MHAIKAPETVQKRADIEHSEAGAQESNQEGPPAGSGRGAAADAQSVGIWEN